VAARGHTPVLADEVVKALKINAKGIYIDATFGRGGHSRLILNALGEHGRLIVIDRDPEAVEFAKGTIEEDPRVTVFRSSFSRLKKITDSLSITGKVDGIIFDLGVSSPQLDNKNRGFSFSADGPLDMRMDPGTGLSASEWLGTVEVGQLERVLREFGEERQARRIAQAIAKARQQRPIQTTHQLVKIIEQAVPKRDPNKHPATRTFQAIRMFLNQELENLLNVLPQVVELLTAGGRLVIISFESLEDRIVKRFLRKESRGDPFPIDLPITSDQMAPRLRLIGKTIRPGPREIDKNPRARSAVMRVAERTELACA